MISCIGLAAHDTSAKLSFHSFSRAPLAPNEVLIKTIYCGICHSDLHAARNDWGKTHYPIVPGHEIIGQIIQIGSAVFSHKIGDYVGVGCLVNSCGECESCLAQQQQFCPRAVWTYNSRSKDTISKGGYSNLLIAHENFAFSIPKDAPLAECAPLLCAGITTFSPLKFAGVKAGDKVAIAGFGGLGHMGAAYAQAMGAKVSIIARNERKRSAAQELGYEYFSDVSTVKERFDFILITIPDSYDPHAYLRLLKPRAQMGIVGLPPLKANVNISILELARSPQQRIFGSLIGGVEETRQMLDFSLKHKIYPKIKIIRASQINQAYYDLLNNPSEFRYVLDTSTISELAR